MSKSSDRAGIYSRNSKGGTKSIGEQDAECARDVLAEGWTIADRYADGVSASRFSKKARPDWDRLLGDLEAGKLDILVLWEASRGDRDAETWLGLLRRCRDGHTRIRVTSDERTFDLARPSDWKDLASAGVDSHHESEKISLRVRRTTAASAAKGLPHGRTTYGYLRRYDPETKDLVEQTAHPEQAAIVVEIASRIARGHPVVTVTNDLNARGVPAPRGGAWTRRTVKSIATSATYLGQRVHHGETFAAIWPPLVDDLTHLAAKRVLSDPARKTTRPGRQKWLLSYLAVCDVCDGTLHRIPMRDNLQRPDRYQCVVGHTGIRAVDLDEYVSESVCRRLALKDGIDLAAGDDVIVLAARTEAATLQARLDDFRDSAIRGETSPVSLARIETQILADIAAVQKRAAAAVVPPVIRDLVEGLDEDLVDDVEARYEEIRRRFDALPIASRREVINILLEVRVRRADHGGRHGFDPDRVIRKWRH